MEHKKLELSNMLFPPYHSYLLKKKYKQLHLKIREQKGVVYVAQMFLKSVPC